MEGIYYDEKGYTFISSTGKLASKRDHVWIFGDVSRTDSKWSFNPPADWLSGDAVRGKVSGSGSFQSKSSMVGTYQKVGESSIDIWGPQRYSISNALAVDQGSVAGRWNTEGSIVGGDDVGMSIDVDPSGSFTGTSSGDITGVCSVSGTLSLAEPGSSKNLYNLRMKAANAARGTEKECQLGTLQSYEGLSAIILAPAGTYESEGYYRYLGFNSRTSFDEMFTMFLRQKLN